MQRLGAAMPRGVATVLAALAARGGLALIVGGAVRDSFLRRPIRDWDLATDLPSAIVSSLFDRVARSGERHNTLMVLPLDGPVEVSSLRCPEADAASAALPAQDADSRTARQRWMTSDLAHRDFTINAMAVTWPEGLVIDPFDGQRDLRAGCVRAVGSPGERFLEDGLRAWRAVRIAATLGFVLDAGTAAALSLAVPALDTVARERKGADRLRLSRRAARLITIASQKTRAQKI